MTQRLVLHNSLGDVVRVMPWTQPQQLWAVLRQDTRRLEVLSSLRQLEQEEVPYTVVKEIAGDELGAREVSLGAMGFLRLEDSAHIQPNLSEAEEANDSLYRRAMLAAVFLYVLLSLFITQPWNSAVEEVAEKVEEKKREIVKVVQKKLVIPQKASRPAVTIAREQKTPTTAKPKQGWKRQGALAALGQLSKSNQQGGLNLGAMKASAGPGLGGSQGSGGVQTSLYGKGLIAAPLGAGNNLQGGGGYGTKGKGGGQAGFGSVSLIGSTGASLIPIPQEAAVEGGLSSDLIADVVRRNLGQVRFCYEKGLQLEPQLAGRVNVAWTIDPQGRVKVAQVKNTSLNSKIVEECILQRLKTWKFPLPQNNAEVKVSYPFLLKRVGNS